MPNTYNPAAIDFTGDDGQKRNAVRLLIRDTASPWVFDDAEIDAIIGEWENVYQAAAQLVELIIGAGAGVESKKVGDLTIQYYERMLPKWRSRGLSHQEVFVGGISIADKDVIEEDSDAVTPGFSRGQHEQDGGQVVNPALERVT